MPEPLQQTAVVADRARRELLATVRELDRRRRLALDLKYHFSWVLIFAAASLVAVGATVAVTPTRWRNRKARTGRERLRGLVRAWNHPQRIATPAPKLYQSAVKIAGVVLIELLAKFTFEQVRVARSRHRLRERGNGRMPAHLPDVHRESV
jgi:hypothetical protein